MQRDCVSRFEARPGQDLLVDVGRSPSAVVPGLEQEVTFESTHGRDAKGHCFSQRCLTTCQLVARISGARTQHRLEDTLVHFLVYGPLNRSGIKLLIEKRIRTVIQGMAASSPPLSNPQRSVKEAVLEGGVNRYGAIICLSGFFKLISLRSISRERLN